MTSIQGRQPGGDHGLKRRSGRYLALAAAVGIALAGGCYEELDDPDNDDRRGRAKLIPIGQVVTDAVTPPIDAVDWKRIETPGRGFLTVNIFWDAPTLDASFMLSDKYGVTVQEIRRDRRTPSDQIIVRSEEQTFFFVKIESYDNGSVYSLQTSFADAGDGLDGSDAPIPELISYLEPPPEPEPEKEEGEKKEEKKEGGGPDLPGGGAPAKKDGGDKPAVSNKPVDPGGDSATNEPTKVKIDDLVPDYTGEFEAAEAQILRVIPKALGGSEITIGAGSNNNVAVNMIGEIIMPDGKRLEGGRFKVSEVYKNT
ncbi:MAG: hypothetical protein AAFS10_09045, partial [Myxococcota bacterium]